MSDQVYKSVELARSPTMSVEDAVRTATERASRTLHDLRWFEVTQLRGHVEQGAVKHWQFTMRVGFTLDE
jgi:flavin-binding protein dodecin